MTAALLLLTLTLINHVAFLGVAAEARLVYGRVPESYTVLSTPPLGHWAAAVPQSPNADELYGEVARELSEWSAWKTEAIETHLRLAQEAEERKRKESPYSEYADAVSQARQRAFTRTALEEAAASPNVAAALDMVQTQVGTLLRLAVGDQLYQDKGRLAEAAMLPEYTYDVLVRTALGHASFNNSGGPRSVDAATSFAAMTPLPFPAPLSTRAIRNLRRETESTLNVLSSVTLSPSSRTLIEAVSDALGTLKDLTALLDAYLRTVRLVWVSARPLVGAAVVDATTALSKIQSDMVANDEATAKKRREMKELLRAQTKVAAWRTRLLSLRKAMSRTAGTVSGATPSVSRTEYATALEVVAAYRVQSRPAELPHLSALVGAGNSIAALTGLWADEWLSLVGGPFVVAVVLTSAGSFGLQWTTRALTAAVRRRGRRLGGPSRKSPLALVVRYASLVIIILDMFLPLLAPPVTMYLANRRPSLDIMCGLLALLAPHQRLALGTVITALCIINSYICTYTGNLLTRVLITPPVQRKVKTS